jgi:hypothetical protein
LAEAYSLSWIATFYGHLPFSWKSP